MITIEDVNSALFKEQGFWVCEIDLSQITTRTENYNNVKIDFCTVSREKLTNGKYRFTVIVDNPLWTNSFYLKDSNGVWIVTGAVSINSRFPLVFSVDESNVVLCLYMGVLKLSTVFYKQDYIIGREEVNVNYNMLNKPYDVTIRALDESWPVVVTINSLTVSYHLIKRTPYSSVVAGYLFVRLLKTDFQFNCTQTVTVGRINKVQLGTHNDYKPNGDLVGSYTPIITVDYKGETLPVQYDSTNNDYYFNLDLTDKTNTGKVRFTVNVDTNDVLNASSTDVSLDSDYELINSVSKFNSFVQTGGVGRLGANLGFTADININKDVYIIGNDKSIDLTGHSIIVNSDKSFKAENTVFTNGEPCIIQHTDSKVELTDCTVTGCTGIGSVIKCDIDLTSLDNPNDFTTVLNGCTLADNTNMILHSGDLNVNNCTVDGAIGSSKYPYFLYQVDGTATLIANTFNIEKDSQITSDIGFNSCIFMVGETAIINGLSHSEWQDNALTSFLESPQFNRSTVDLTYYYDLIMDYITMTASNGYCHAVSGEDFVFKANCNVRRD